MTISPKSKGAFCYDFACFHFDKNIPDSKIRNLISSIYKVFSKIIFYIYGEHVQTHTHARQSHTHNPTHTCTSTHIHTH